MCCGIVDVNSLRCNTLVVTNGHPLDHHDHRKFHCIKHSMLLYSTCPVMIIRVCSAEPPHEDGDDEDIPEADEEERKNIFSIRNTLGVSIVT